MHLYLIRHGDAEDVELAKQRGVPDADLHGLDSDQKEIIMAQCYHWSSREPSQEH